MAAKVQKHDAGDSLNAEINIIPLVDIMLVLLIIFMVAAPLMNDSVDVKLPKAKAKAAGVEEESVIVAVQKDNTIYIGKTAVAFDMLNEKLGAIFANRERKRFSFVLTRLFPTGLSLESWQVFKTRGSIRFHF